MAVLTGKVAVVTGGGTGIGLAIARYFRDEGARVFITGRRKDTLDAAVAELGEGVTAVVGDTSVAADVDALYETVREQAGHVDVVVANAAVSETAPFSEITEEYIDTHFDINVKGVVFTVQKSLPLLRPGASIIMIGSVSATRPSPGQEIYAATKAAVRSLARGLAHSSREHGFRINVLAPGLTRTPGLVELLPEEVLDQIRQTIPLDRLAAPDEIAAAATFLASDASSYMNGSELAVDGGGGQI